MPTQSTILKQFRVVFTALTLLCALFLNYQEVSTFAAAKPAPTKNEQVNKTEKKPDFTLKQKISFEAVTSFILLPAPLAAVLTDFNFTFIPARTVAVLPVIAAGLPYISRLLGTAIQPNAP